MVVLDVDLEGESGWLTCAKLIHERPHGKVVLLSEEKPSRNREMAAFVGAAALMHRQECLLSLPKPIAKPTPLPAVG